MEDLEFSLLFSNPQKLDPRIIAFAASHPDACMTTLRRDGSAHVARIEIAVVDGHIWSTGSPSLVRTRNLRRDPRCSLFVFGPHPVWIGLETEVRILDGDVSESLVRLMRARHREAAPPGKVLAHDEELGRDRLYDEDEYVELVRTDAILIYQFEVRRSYGNY
jgi:Pyridoxamine 5'-phosphate oxidase